MCAHFGDVSVLPTPVFFYGMGEREEVGIDIDPGKTLVVRLQGSAPPDEEGVGQRVLRAERAAARRPNREGRHGLDVVHRPKADGGNPAHVPAPMPGMVVTVAVRPGQPVRAGDPLVSIEAMKMESQSCRRRAFEGHGRGRVGSSDAGGAGVICGSVGGRGGPCRPQPRVRGTR